MKQTYALACLNTFLYTFLNSHCYILARLKSDNAGRAHALASTQWDEGEGGNGWGESGEGKGRPQPADW